MVKDSRLKRSFLHVASRKGYISVMLSKKKPESFCSIRVQCHKSKDSKFLSSFAQCGNYGILLSHFFGKNFVKATFLLKILPNSWFDEIFFSFPLWSGYSENYFWAWIFREFKITDPSLECTHKHSLRMIQIEIYDCKKKICLDVGHCTRNEQWPLLLSRKTRCTWRSLEHTSAAHLEIMMIEVIGTHFSSLM